MGNADKNTETGNSKTQSAVVAALVIGLLAGFFIGRSWEQEGEEIVEKAPVENVEDTSAAKEAVKPEVKTEESVKKETVSSGGATGMVTVVDQKAGISVAISKVTFSDAGWIVVREDTGNGMGSILGAQWLPAGTASDVSVDLLRKTEANKNYFVALYTDNGDKKFDKVTDLPIAVDGKVVSGIFSAK